LVPNRSRDAWIVAARVSANVEFDGMRTVSARKNARSI
jgi:hypothetical protein